MSVALYAYPWNFHDLDADVSRVRALGAEEISLAVSYHAGKFLQPGDPKARVYFPEDGCVYFHPRKSYGALTPKVAQLTQGRDVLAELCARGDIAVNAWTVLNHNTRLGTQRPDLCARNAFGDVYPYSLCPSQPEVRAYDVTLCADIAETYKVRRLLLESPGWLTYAHGFHHEFAQVPGNPWLDGLLGLCFCDACKSGATAVGIDAEGLAARVCAQIDAFLDGEGEAPALDSIHADPDMAAYHRFRCEVTTALVRDIRAAVNPAVKVKVISTCQRPHATAWLEGHDLAALDQVSDGLELPLYQPDAGAVMADARWTLARAPAERTSVILRPGHPDLTTQGDLDLALSGLRALGVTDFAFYNLGLLRAADLRRLQKVLSQQVSHV
ncbi:MAG: hypothetical protein ACTHLA_09500 [Asticcacaulis sp.]|uniref:hypothetical protein n=1 Tax=Asticcacaulis sp. TaxID=1872648 RepID=UPI003F7C925E